MKTNTQTVEKTLKIAVVAIFSITALLMFWSFMEGKKILDNCIATGGSREQCQKEVKAEKDRRAKAQKDEAP